MSAISHSTNIDIYRKSHLTRRTVSPVFLIDHSAFFPSTTRKSSAWFLSYCQSLQMSIKPINCIIATNSSKVSSIWQKILDVDASNCVETKKWRKDEQKINLKRLLFTMMSIVCEEPLINSMAIYFTKALSSIPLSFSTESDRRAKQA